uniref:Uncharacterized protein n=1 Tax=Aegilops tauschii subsp. strangulata TaxID=200361 RepID=A0A453JKK1_AEGTS
MFQHCMFCSISGGGWDQPCISPMYVSHCFLPASFTQILLEELYKHNVFHLACLTIFCSMMKVVAFCNAKAGWCDYDGSPVQVQSCMQMQWLQSHLPLEVSLGPN